MGSLARPSLTGEEMEQLSEDADVECVLDNGSAWVFEVSGFFDKVAYDTIGLAARVGDYNGEYVGREAAREMVTPIVADHTDALLDVTVVKKSRGDELIPDHSDVYYKVVVVAHE